MSELAVKTLASQEPSVGMKGFINDIFLKMRIPTATDEIKKDRANYEVCKTKIQYPLDGSITQDQLRTIIEKKLGNFISVENAMVSNDEEFIFVFITGYVDKFHPSKFFHFIKFLVKEIVYDSHKMNITSEDRDVSKVFLAHSYSYSFEEAVFVNVKKLVEEFKSIKEYEVKQHPNYLDNFEVIIRGVKKDD